MHNNNNNKNILKNTTAPNIIYVLHVILRRSFLSAKIPKKNIKPFSIIFMREKPRVLLIKNEDWSRKNIKVKKSGENKKKTESTRDTGLPSFTLHFYPNAECQTAQETKKKHKTFQSGTSKYIIFIRTVYRFGCNRKISFSFSCWMWSCGAAVDWLNGKDVPFGCNANHKMAFQNKCC